MNALCIDLESTSDHLLSSFFILYLFASEEQILIVYLDNETLSFYHYSFLWSDFFLFAPDFP